MRFESISALQTFLSVLSSFGYLVPILNYKEELKSHGLDKHISYYTWSIEVDYSDNTLSLILMNCGKVLYIIKCKKEKR